jgi:hypothetical protein
VTLTETRTEQRTEQPVAPEAQLLFQEARQRRRQRRLTAGITAVVLVVILVLTLLVFGISGRGAPASSARSAPPTGAIAASASASAFSIRPVLCYAPAYAGAGTPGTTGSGSLPNCAPAFALTSSNLDVTPGSGPFTVKTIGPDPQLARIPSTPRAGDTPGSTVLLPGDGATGPPRYVLAPAALTAADIRSAHAQRVDGIWTVDIGLTGRGSALWDRLNATQFHALIGFAWNGHVVSAAIVDPTQTFFRSFDGRGQIAGGITQHEAKAMAAGI